MLQKALVRPSWRSPAKYVAGKLEVVVRNSYGSTASACSIS